MPCKDTACPYNISICNTLIQEYINVTHMNENTLRTFGKWFSTKHPKIKFS